MRETLLKNLTALENRLASEGLDVYDLGHRMNLGPYNDVEYQDSDHVSPNWLIDCMRVGLDHLSRIADQAADP